MKDPTGPIADEFRPPDPQTELGAALALALACSDEADALALGSFRQAIEVEAKPDASFVTAADRAVERAIRTRIAARFPDHGLVGEEYGVEEGAAGAGGERWIIDPIDGTHSFMRGVPVFATLLALEVEGSLAVGVVSAPALRRRWFAWRGGGAWVVGTGSADGERDAVARLSVSGVREVAMSHLVFSSASPLRHSELTPGFDTLVERVWRDRGFGDFWGYMLVAEGAAEVMLERDLSLWDIAAPRLIVEEAGGRLSDLTGGLDLPAKGVLATNGVLHDEVLAILGGDAPAG
jgi:histidinol-phosphatase